MFVDWSNAYRQAKKLHKQEQFSKQTMSGKPEAQSSDVTPEEQSTTNKNAQQKNSLTLEQLLAEFINGLKQYDNTNLGTSKGTSNSPLTTDENENVIFETTRVRLRDGVELAVDYLVVSNIGRFPVILELTPYGRGPDRFNYRYEASYWRKYGYAFVIADCRGTGDSDGEMVFFSREGQDGYDLIEWIANQPWSNGRIGMRGSSYTGTNQWFIAREQPPHLSCITPSATMGRPMQDVPYFDGAFAVGWAINWISRDLNIN
ncbi:unnamed protein product, partial [Rotaria sordida]